MRINKVIIENYKCFEGKFSLELNNNVNILVGNNESGKSTILEAVNLALTGLLNGRYLKNKLSPYLFNHQVTEKFKSSLQNESAEPQLPPSICIEVFFDGNDAPRLQGTGNSSRIDACGLSLKIEFDPEYQSEYEALIKSGELNAIPIEYYRIAWKSFARDTITARSIPLKSALIDSSSTRYQNGSDVYISRIIHADLDDTDKAAVSQEFRKLKEKFGAAEAVERINEQIKNKSKISDKNLSISVDLATHNSWQTSLMTYLDDIPFHQAGQGEQCIIKTNLALGRKNNQEANLILLEEPENHLSHTRLNQLLSNIEAECSDKQVLVSTHSSFVANKLGLENIILLNNGKTVSFDNLPEDTFDFFKKLPGYQTLRLLLCKKAVLVEGPSDELTFQKAYMRDNDGKLPISNGIDVISVGLSFKRFLDIAKAVNQPTAVITDNDGDYAKKVSKKYSEYDKTDSISIFADKRDNLNTLEPQFVDANKKNLTAFCKIINLNQNSYDSSEKICDYMLKNKTDWALRIFEAHMDMAFPQYITNAVRWCNG